MFFHTDSCAFASLDSLPTGTVQRALLGSTNYLLRTTIAGTAFGRFLRGKVAMSSLRQLNADQPQTYCPRTLLIMRATRYFLKQSITTHSIPCFLARSQLCVSGHRFTFLHRSTGSSRFLELIIVGSFGPSQPALRRTQKPVSVWNSTKTRLTLHTRPATPAASF